MGLHQGNSSRQQSRGLGLWLLPIAAVSVALILALFADTGRTWLSFDRPAITAGEFWRLLSGHFVHLGVSHLILNAAGLLLIWTLIGTSFSRGQWLIVSLFIIFGIDLGFWFREPDLHWYVGLSGLLHGLLAAGVIGELKSGRIDIWILGAALIGKLGYEQLVGPLPGSEQSSGGTVIVAAHAYGAIAGAIAAGLVMIRVRSQAPI